MKSRLSWLTFIATLLFIFNLFTGHAGENGKQPFKSQFPEIAKRRVLVTLKSGSSDFNKFKSELEKQKIKFQVVREFRGFVVLQFNEEPSDALIETIGKFPQVAHIRRDELLHIQSGAEPVCRLRASGSPVTTIAAVASKILKEPCQFTTQCKSGHNASAWKTYADLDLMQEAMPSLISKEQSSAVVVLDSGFNKAGFEDLIEKKRISYKASALTEHYYPYAKSPGIPHEDFAFHGTAVTGLIIGNDGLGLSPQSQVDVYQIADMDGNSVASDTIYYALKACIERQSLDPDGITIINISSGGSSDAGTNSWEYRFFSELLKLKQAGCLVIKSQENGGAKKMQQKALASDILLRIANIDTDGKIVSEEGELAAPGTSVLALYPDYKSGATKCGDTFKKSLVRGTSFSAPIVSAITSNVVMILKQSDKFKRLSMDDRLRLLRSILDVSVMSGSVNGLRAIYLAKAWADWKYTFVSNSNIKDLLSEQRVGCNLPNEKCTEKEECSTKSTCFKSLRKKYALCIYKSAESNPGAKIDHLDSAENLLLFIASLMQEAPSQATEFTEKYLRAETEF